MRPLIIYVIEANSSVRASMARMLRSAGLEPKPFESVRAFLAAVGKEGPACLLLDIDSSAASVQELKSRLEKRGGDLPVVALSARDEESTRTLARELGAQFFLSKPVDDQALLDAIAWVRGPAPAG